MKNDELEALYKKYFNELFIYALSLCKDQHLAQDLVSETFFKALLSIEYNEQYIKYWLFRVCKNLYLDYLRRNKYLQDLESHLDKLFVEDDSLNKIIISEEKKRIYYEILKLQSSYKEVIILYYYCAFPLKEIASITGISQGSARTLLFRARRKLKDELKEDYSWVLKIY